VLPLLIATVLMAWPHRHDRLPEQVAPVGFSHFWRLFKQPGVFKFLSIALLMQMGFGPFYVYFTLHMQNAGHSGLEVGLLWGLGVAIEILMFWHAPQLIQRFGIARLMQVSLLITVLRWLVTALFASSLWIVALAQSTHALGFAVFHSCCMQRLGQLFSARDAGHGQSLLYGFSSGIGGVIGALFSAYLWRHGAGVYAFIGGAVVTALAFVLLLSSQPQHWRTQHSANAS
jgi:MFS transporter, PPP family, 3-phenylpropionic acid transporter